MSRRTAGEATWFRFGLVGVLNTITDLAGYTLLALAGVPSFAANLASTSAGMALSFTLNRSFTFRARPGSVRTQAVLFVLLTSFGLWVLQPVVIGLTTGAFDGLGPVPAVAGPKLAGLSAGVLWNYTAYTWVVFRPE
ncbi:GtrA family protein [Lentzea sp. E54]|uniref:GtrA family protein n=1 Tax=Lentzea xerophila TaxID=3435883 RepID=UPI003DA4CF9B